MNDVEFMFTVHYNVYTIWQTMESNNYCYILFFLYWSVFDAHCPFWWPI